MAPQGVNHQLYLFHLFIVFLDFQKYFLKFYIAIIVKNIIIIITLITTITALLLKAVEKKKNPQTLGKRKLGKVL